MSVAMTKKILRSKAVIFATETDMRPYLYKAWAFVRWHIWDKFCLRRALGRATIEVVDDG